MEENLNHIQEQFYLDKYEFMDSGDNKIELDESYECTSRNDNNKYFIKCVYYNCSSQIFTSKNKSFAEVRLLYKSIKEEMNQCLKKIELYSLKNDTYKVIYEKEFKISTYHHEKALSIVEQTLEKLEEFQNYFGSLISQLSIVDKRVDTLKHNIEVSDYENEEECLKLFSELKGALTLRREIKNSIIINQQIDSQKSMKALKNINVKLQRSNMKDIEDKMTNNIVKGMNDWKNISNKITVIPYENEDEMNEAKKKLKKINNCIRVDNYNKYVAGFNLLNKNIY